MAKYDLLQSSLIGYSNTSAATVLIYNNSQIIAELVAS